MSAEAKIISDSARRAASLFVVFAVAKIALVILRVLDGAATGLLSPSAAVALLLPDLQAALIVYAIDFLITNVFKNQLFSRLLWTSYALAAAYAALNVPIARVFSTPLTFPMLAAAGGAIADSIRIQIKASNAAALAVVLVSAVLAPRVLGRVKKPRAAVIASMAVLGTMLLIVGPRMAAGVPTIGLHRNAFGALLSSLRERLSGPGDSLQTMPAEPPLGPEGTALDLSRFMGAAAGRNVIWINLESTAAAYLPAWGAARDPMPHFSELARGALIFENIYATYPESIKGLFSMLCAVAPAAHTSGALYTEARFPCRSLPETLHAAGYHTAMFHSGWFAYLGMRGIVDGRGFDRLEDAGDVGGAYRSSFGVDEPATVNRALAWIDARGDARPFFLMYLPIAGHHPYNAPGPPDDPHPFGRDSDFNEYSNDLYRGDRALARLVDGVRARGLDDRTLWVIAGDHGEAFQQHEGNFAHTLFVYEENVHVPFIVRAPGLQDTKGNPMPGGLRVPQIGGTIDLAPTLLALLGLVPAPARWQGHSLLDGKPGVAHFYVDQAVWLAGLRSGPWKYILDMESGRSQLFRLDSDLGEQHDVAASEAERVRRYREHVRAWAARQRSVIGRAAATSE